MDVIQAFASQQLKLLQEEKNAELEQTAMLQANYSPQELQKFGVCLVGLAVTGIRTGLGGKTCVDFEKETGTTDCLPSHNLKPGDIVDISEYSSKTKNEKKSQQGSNATGVVFKVTDQCISVSFKDEIPDVLMNRCTITKMANNITYERMQNAIKALTTEQKIEHHPLVQVLLGLSKPAWDSLLLTDIEFYDSSLNDSQKEAVRFALSSLNCSIIHGPPGTGKTHTLIEVIRQLVKRGDRVLVCGPSNLSVDNLVERLSKCKLDLVRLGHPARILPSVMDHALDVRIKTCDQGQIVTDVRQELDQKLKSIPKAKRADRKSLYQDIKHLRNEVKQREKAVVEGLVKNANVVLSTLNGSASRLMQYEHFDTLVIDEASQALEAECWIALLKAKRVIFAGDHLQLPPTIKSTQSGGPGKPSLEITLIDRLLKQYGKSVKRLLNTQYRMNAFIMNFSSQQFYDGELKAHDSVKDRLLTDCEDVIKTEETESPLYFIDTTGKDFQESSDQNSKYMDDSKLNQGEADLVVKHVNYLISQGVKDDDIAIISPYNAQVNLLKLLLRDAHPKLEIGTVDGFQGREKQVVILTLVRSNDRFEIGFLSESRRLNVALTRAKSHLVLICDGEFLSASKDKVLKKMVEYFEEHALIAYPD